MSARTNSKITINIKANGTTILATSGQLDMPNINESAWNLIIEFTIRTLGGQGNASIVTFGQLHVLKSSNNDQLGFGFNTVNNITFDTTVSNTLDITAIWSGNGNGDNNIYSNIFTLTKIY